MPRNTAAKARPIEAKAGKPDVFKYHDYRALVKDWLAYKKASQSAFSLRAFALKAGLSVSYLSMIASGGRKLTRAAAAKLAAALELTPSERTYFELLTVLGNSDSQEERLEAYDRMCQLRPYRRTNPAENATFRYLAHWYYVAIREMASLPDFKLDANWIQANLGQPVDRKGIEKALKFLIDNGYIVVGKDGKAEPPSRSLDCQGGVYRLALTRFHREMFSVAARSIDSTPSDQRNILGYTLAVDDEKFDRVRALLDETYRKLAEIAAEPSKAQSVYHVELALFPLTSDKERKKK